MFSICRWWAHLWAWIWIWSLLGLHHPDLRLRGSLDLRPRVWGDLLQGKTSWGGGRGRGRSLKTPDQETRTRCCFNWAEQSPCRPFHCEPWILISNKNWKPSANLPPNPFLKLPMYQSDHQSLFSSRRFYNQAQACDSKLQHTSSDSACCLAVGVRQKFPVACVKSAKINKASCLSRRLCHAAGESSWENSLSLLAQAVSNSCSFRMWQRSWTLHCGEWPYPDHSANWTLECEILTSLQLCAESSHIVPHHASIWLADANKSCSLIGQKPLR